MLNWKGLCPVISQLLYKMYATEEYKINRVVLKTLGLWPYQQSYFAEIRKVFFLGILSTLIIAQVYQIFTIFVKMIK